MQTSNSKETWTLQEAKAHLARVLRLAETDGPQYIRAAEVDGRSVKEGQDFVVVPANVWQKKNAPEKQLPDKHLGKWLVENTPRGTNLEIPTRRETGRRIPFIDEADE